MFMSEPAVTNATARSAPIPPTAHVSEAGSPVGWSAVKMHDSDDIDALRDALRLDAIQETVGKLGHQNTAEPPAERRVRGGKRE